MKQPNQGLLKKGNEKGVEDRKKVIAIHAYNKGRSGVDLSDRMASYDTALRKCIKWYRKLATKSILGVCIVNALIIIKRSLERRFRSNNFEKGFV